MLLKLALKDLLFDRLISACQIAAIAAILSPLLLLFSLRHGILTELEDKLLQDPKVLSLTLDTSYRLSEDFFIKLRQEPEVGFVIPEVAALSALVDIRFSNGVKRVSVMPTAPGDPVVINSGIVNTGVVDTGMSKVSVADTGNNKDTDTSVLKSVLDTSFKSVLDTTLGNDEVYITEDLAKEREIKVGDQLLVVVSRTLMGQRQAARVKFTVRGIIKQRFVSDDFLATNLHVLTCLDDYRNGYEPEIFSDGSYVKTTPRFYAKFRLFAKDIDSVIPLYYKLVEQHLSVSSKVGEIENIQAITRVLTFIFVVIALVSGIGGALALSGLMLSSLKSRKRNFVLLRLMGQSSGEIYALVCVENFILASLGFGLALVFYLTGSQIFNQYFGALMPQAMISHLTWIHGLSFYGSTVVMAEFLALWSAKYIFLKAHIADVLREV